MGQYLSSPITDKENVSGSRRTVEYGISAHQGWRKNMEDAHIAHHYESLEDVHLFAVFDGHGGPEVAKFCSKYMPGELEKLQHFKDGDFPTGLEQVFHRMDDMMRSAEGGEELEKLRTAAASSRPAADAEEGEDTYEMLRKLVALQRLQGQQAAAAGQAAEAAGPSSSEAADPSTAMTFQAGCTAVVALLQGNRLFVANAGDSRAVLCRNGEAVPLSEDHKPAAVTERERIIAAGGFLSDIGGITRVNGNLNLSRAIGDLRYKMNQQLEAKDQIITAQPDVQSHSLLPTDTFLVLACDGIWDVMTNQQVVDFVSERLARSLPPASIADELLDACVARDPREARGIGCDNMTATIIVLKQPGDGPGHATEAPASHP